MRKFVKLPSGLIVPNRPGLNRRQLLAGIGASIIIPNKAEAGFLLNPFKVNPALPLDLGSSTQKAFTANASSYTTSHTVPSGTNLLLVGHSSGVGSTGRTITSITWNGTAMTQAAGINRSSGTQALVYFYYLLSPAAGTFNIVATYSSTTTSAACWALNFSGANGTTPIDAFATDDDTSGTTLTPSLTTSKPALVYGIHLRYNSAVITFTESSGATNVATLTSTGGASSRHNLLSEEKAAPGTYNFGSTASAAGSRGAFCSVAVAT